MGKTKDKQHRLSGIGLEVGKALCSICGIVEIQMQGNSPRCGNRQTSYNRAKKIRQRYGLTIEDVQAMTDACGGLCEACGDRPGTFIDHDHSSGTVRGLLCPGCNTALGQLGDSLQRAEGLVKYLSRPR